MKKSLKGSLLPSNAASLWLLFFLMFWSNFNAQGQLILNPFKPLAEDTLPKAKREGLLLLPLLYYTPDTRFAAGAMGVYYFHLGADNSATRLSYIKLLADYTQNKQLDLWSSWNVFTEGERYLFKGELRFRNFPDRFYGIGNNSLKENEERFEYKLFSMKFLALRKFAESWFLGMNFNIEKEFDFERSIDGQLNNGNITGYDGGLAIGPGIVSVFDTRDNVINAQKGMYLEVNAFWNLPFLGGTFDYGRMQIEFNRYFPMARKTTLAWNTRAIFSTGEVPFLDMPRLGSDQILRGYPSYRYRDKNFMATQLEYRFPVYKRFGMTVFSGLGEVFSQEIPLEVNRIKYSYGVGFRYLADASEKLNIRFDLGFGENSYGFYILLTEAF